MTFGRETTLVYNAKPPVETAKAADLPG